MIPSVAASERGRAQTSLRAGVVGPQRGTVTDRRRTLKGPPKRVQAP